MLKRTGYGKHLTHITMKKKNKNIILHNIITQTLYQNPKQKKVGKLISSTALSVEEFSDY